MAMEMLNITAAEIEYGDKVIVSPRDEFYAWSDGELDQWGDTNVNDGQKYRTLNPKQSVTVERRVKAEEYSYNG